MPFFQNVAERLHKLKRGKAKEAKNEAVVVSGHELAGPPAVRTEDIGVRDVQHNSFDPHDVQEHVPSAIDIPLGQGA
jgi:hypothetical protein